MHELMNKMYSVRDKEERKAIVNQMREIRKNRHVATSPKVKDSQQRAPQTKLPEIQPAVSSSINSHIEEGSQLYQVPFASSGNRIYLSVANASERLLEKVKVEAINKPEWLNISPSIQNISNINPNDESQAEFNFSIDKSMTVNEEHIISFKISTQSGEN
ncbi:MAG: hypothetical protein C0417_12665 [Chlorobiaceae bacterium]|nr:hypothetical protein [Chlorobiaceae bacterium]